MQASRYLRRGTVRAGKQSARAKPRLVIAAAGLGALAAAALATQASGAAPRFEGVPLGTFKEPTYVTQAPGEPQLVFVVEQGGRVKVVQNGVPLARPFLDIAHLVRSGGEEGLLSIAFPPDYQQTHRFYAYFTGRSRANEVDEFETSASNPVHARRASRRVVIRIPHPHATNHNGGQLQFGPDGLLYIGTGDGGATPQDARKLDKLNGKVLRINPRQHGDDPYQIPAANPFVGIPDRRPEIFAYGFRNPFRFSFDGEVIAIGEVGEGSWEEVDMLGIHDARGANFGWPKYEGDKLWPGNPPGPDPPDPPTFPLFTYPHNNGRCAIIGGYIVHDPALPDLAGRYLYGDLCTGAIRSFIPNVAAQTVADDKPVNGVSAPQITSFGQGHAGQIYYAQRTGEVFQLEETPQ
jgi:hypothetical protein